MGDATLDILMVTYNRLDYTRLALPRLLDSCDSSMRVWLWHNGTDEPTLRFVQEQAKHPRVHQFHHSVENKRLWEPTHWIMTHSKAELISKVDDDNLMPDKWGAKMRAAHASEPKLGVLGCWPFMPEDVVPELVEKKLINLPAGGQVMQNCWVGGTGFVMKSECIRKHGPQRQGQTFPNYCVHLAAAGWINGWFYPFIYMPNLDDPRCDGTLLKTEADLASGAGLSARRAGVKSIRELRERQTKLAHQIQLASVDPKLYVGWRAKLRNAVKPIRKLVGAAGV